MFTGSTQRSRGAEGRIGTIVLYERDELMYELLREWLTEAGYVVRDSADDERDTPALAIVSISMPRIENKVLTHLIRRQHPGTPIIALSSQARSGLSSDGRAACDLNVDRIVAKPMRRTELLAAVRATIGPAPHA